MSELKARRLGDSSHSDATVLYVGGAPPQVWNFRIEGYQVCEKRLMARRGWTLACDHMERERGVATVFSEAIRRMAAINAAISEWPTE